MLSVHAPQVRMQHLDARHELDPGLRVVRHRLTSQELLFQPLRSDYPSNQYEWRLPVPEGALRVWILDFGCQGFSH